MMETGSSPHQHEPAQHVRRIAAVAGNEMAARRQKKPRTVPHGLRQGFGRAAEHFLRECYQKKKPARGKDFARSLDLTPEYVSWLAA